jgi:hypothetical protein
VLVEGWRVWFAPFGESSLSLFFFAPNRLLRPRFFCGVVDVMIGDQCVQEDYDVIQAPLEQVI